MRTWRTLLAPLFGAFAVADEDPIAVCEDGVELVGAQPGHSLAQTSRPQGDASFLQLRGKAELKSALQLRALAFDGLMDAAGAMANVGTAIPGNLPHMTTLLQSVKLIAVESKDRSSIDPSHAMILQQMLIDINETIIPSLITSQQKLEQELNVSRQTVLECENITHGYTNEVAQAEDVEAVHREEHRQCRQQQGGHQVLADVSCDMLSDFLLRIDPCPSNLTVTAETVADLKAGTAASYDHIVEQTDRALSTQVEYWQRVWKEYEWRAEQCRHDSDDRSNCDKLQTGYEHVFCYRFELQGKRDKHIADCLRHAEAYERSAQTAEWKTETAELEYISLRKIECFIHVIVTYNSSADEQSRALDACGVLEVDVTPVQITIRELGNVTTYPLPSEPYPGHRGWLSHAYPGLHGVTETHISCPPDGAGPANTSVPTPRPTPGQFFLPANASIPSVQPTQRPTPGQVLSAQPPPTALPQMAGNPSTATNVALVDSLDSVRDAALEDLSFPGDVVATFSKNFDSTTAGRSRSVWDASRGQLDFFTDDTGHVAVCHDFLLPKAVSSILWGSFRVEDVSNSARDDGGALHEVEDTRHAMRDEGLVIFGTPRSLVKNSGQAVGSGFNYTFSLPKVGVNLPPTRTLRFCTSQPGAAHVRISDIQLRLRPQH